MIYPILQLLYQLINALRKFQYCKSRYRQLKKSSIINVNFFFLSSGSKVPLLLLVPDREGCIFGLTRQKNRIRTMGENKECLKSHVCLHTIYIIYIVYIIYIRSGTFFKFEGLIYFVVQFHRETTISKLKNFENLQRCNYLFNSTV